MSKGFWRRRSLLIGLAIVALSVGIVIASVPFLPSPPVTHSSIQTQTSTPVRGTYQSRPGFYALRLPSISANQNFWVGVNVLGGAASFCVMQYQPYENWAAVYNSSYYPLTSSSCLLGPTQPEAQDTIKFMPPVSGTWVVVALNLNASPITVYFLPAP